MNAYELADYLQKAFYADEDIEKAANMLRQQADRIAELEKQVESCKETNGLLVNTIQAYREEWNKERGIK